MLRIFLVIDDYNELIYLQSLLKKLGFDVEGLQNQKKYADVSLGFNPQVLITTAKGKKVDGLSLSRSITKKRGIPKIIGLRTPGASYSATEFQEAGIDEVLDSPINPRKLILCIANLGGIDETSLLEKYNKMKSNVITEEDAQQIVVHDDQGQPVQDIVKVKAALENAAKMHSDGHAFNVKGENNTVSSNGTPDEPASMGNAPARFPLAGGGEKNVGGVEADNSNLAKNAASATDTAGSASRKERFEKTIREVGKLPNSHFAREKIADFNKKIRANGSAEDIDQIEAERREYVRALFTNNKK